MAKSEYEKLDWHKRPRKFNDKGYAERWVPDHPNNQDSWYLEHRLMMEDYLGRHLDKSEIVHHVNEVKDDNRLDNLFLTNEVEHTLIHKLAKRHTNSTKKRMRRNQIGKQFRRDPNGRFS